MVHPAWGQGTVYGEPGIGCLAEICYFVHKSDCSTSAGRLLLFAGVGWVSLAGCGAGEKEVAFAGVAGKGGGAFELGAGFGVAAQFIEEVGADSGEKMVARKRGLGSEGIYEGEAGLGAVGHGDGDGTVEFDDG